MRLLRVDRIWDQGDHNAFTDLIRWRQRWFCTFREASDHVGGNGQVRVLTSKDGVSWTSAALLAEAGIDLRDPKLSAAPDNRLMIVAGGSVYEGEHCVSRQPRVFFSADGDTWSAPQRILAEGDWLWRVTWHDGRAYGVTYKASGDDWAITLLSSADGVKYDRITTLDVPGFANETTLRVMPDGEMVVLVRREAGTRLAWVGRSEPPYAQWSWHELPHRIGGPNFIRLPNGELCAGGRVRTDDVVTALGHFSVDGAFSPTLTLPSSGDTGYPGMVWHDDQLWVSYYSSHEGKASIYLARVQLA